jgi:hypothetical protein
MKKHSESPSKGSKHEEAFGITGELPSNGSKHEEAFGINIQRLKS